MLLVPVAHLHQHFYLAQSALLVCSLCLLHLSKATTRPQLECPTPSTVPPTLQGQVGLQVQQLVFLESNYSHLSTCPSHQGRGQLLVKTATHVQAKVQVQVQSKVQAKVQVKVLAQEALELTGLSAWPSLPFSWQQEVVLQD